MTALLNSISSLPARAVSWFSWTNFEITTVAQGVFELTSGDLCQAAIDRLQNAQLVLLRSADLTDSGLQFLEQLQGVEVLIQEGAFTIDGLRAVSEMGNLRTWGVDLVATTHASITGEAIAALDLSRMHWLVCFDFDRITNTDLNQILQRVQLKRLDIFHCSQITSAGFASLPNQQSLDFLGIGGVRDFADQQMQAVGRLSSVRTLELYDLPISDAAMRSVRQMGNLHRLILGRVNITDQGLLALRGMPSIREFSANGCPFITQAGVNAIFQ